MPTVATSSWCAASSPKDTMPPKDILDILVYVSAIAVAITVGRTNIKKQTIADLCLLVEAHEKTIKQLREENQVQASVMQQQDHKIVYLEGVVYGNTQLVPGGLVAGSIRQGSGNSPVDPKTSKNRNP